MRNGTKTNTEVLLHLIFSISHPGFEPRSQTPIGPLPRPLSFRTSFPAIFSGKLEALLFNLSADPASLLSYYPFRSKSEAWEYRVSCEELLCQGFFAAVKATQGSGSGWGWRCWRLPPSLNNHRRHLDQLDRALPVPHRLCQVQKLKIQYSTVQYDILKYNMIY